LDLIFKTQRSSCKISRRSADGLRRHRGEKNICGIVSGRTKDYIAHSHFKSHSNATRLRLIQWLIVFVYTTNGNRFYPPYAS